MGSHASGDARLLARILQQGDWDMRRLMVTAFVVVCAGLTSQALAAEKANPTGTWKWTVTANGQERTQTLKLKLEGDKLTGAMVGRNDRETPIEDAKFKNGEVSFKITRERNGQKNVTEYTGKVEGDTLKGKIKRAGANGAGRDFEAKRAK